MLPTTASGILLRMPMISCVPFPPLTGGFHGTWLLKEGVAVLRKKEPLHDYKAGGLAAVAAVLKHLPVITWGALGVGCCTCFLQRHHPLLRHVQASVGYPLSTRIGLCTVYWLFGFTQYCHTYHFSAAGRGHCRGGGRVRPHPADAEACGRGFTRRPAAPLLRGAGWAGPAG